MVRGPLAEILTNPYKLRFSVTRLRKMIEYCYQSEAILKAFVRGPQTKASLTPWGSRGPCLKDF